MLARPRGQRVLEQAEDRSNADSSVEGIRLLRSVATVGAALVSCGIALPAFAQDVTVPAAIRTIVPQARGPGTAVMARAVAQQLGPRFGNTVIVENKAGGSTIIGVSAVMNAPHIDSTLLFISSSLVMARGYRDRHIGRSSTNLIRKEDNWNSV